MLKEKFNILKNNKRQTKTIVLALLMVTMILLMDVSHLFVISDPNDEYTFFFDDFMFTTTNSTALWRGNYHISAGKLAVDEGQISWADFNIGAWNGYNRLILDADIVPDSSSQSARILIRDANSMEILYAIHPSQIYGKIDLSSYVDLTSTSLKLEIHGYCKFDVIRIYTPNLFIHNLLLDDNAEDFGTEILNGLNEQGENPAFSSYSKLLNFAPGVAAGATLETRDYFIPYLNEINLVGLVSRSYYESEECINDSIEITIQAIEYYGKSFEIHTLYSTFDMFDQQPTSFSIPLNQFVGKDIKFKLKVKVITNRLDPSYLPDLFVSYFGITAKSNSKINSRFIDAYDFATKDMFTQITPAMVSGEEKLVLARDRLGDIATYRAFLGTSTNVTYLSGYDLSEYLDTSSGTDGWIPSYGGDGLSADLSTSSEAVISLNNEQPDFTAGYLETSFDLNCYGLAAGIVFRYYSDTEFWAITVQRMEEGRDIAHLIHNGDIVKSAPLMRKLSSLVTIKIEKNSFLDYYQYSYLDYYQFSIDEQYLFKHSTSDPGTKLGLYYRIIDNTKSQQYTYPVVFRSFTLYTIGPNDVTRVYMKVQNPTSKATTLQIKEIFFKENDLLGERIISTINVPHTEGFETIIAECINPAFNSRLIVESLSEQLIYLSEFGFIGYTKFGETTPASLYYDIHEDILTDHRVKENCIVIEYNDEWVTYDIELKNNFVFYVYANATLNNNLVLKIYARKINTEDSFTFLDTIYFIEKDGKDYSHHFYDDLSTHEGFTEGIYEVKITVNSDISVDDPFTFWSLTATEIPDRLQGADYSDIDNNVEGWREEWDIDDGQYTYLNQQEWYTNVGFSSLNGGPMDSWALPYEYNYPEIFLNNPWDFEEDADGWDYAGVYSNIGTEDGKLDVTVSSADRCYFGAYYRTDDTPIDMINTDYNVFRINILVTEIPSGSNGIRLGVGVASDVSDFWGSDTWRYSSWTITETNTWYTFELTFDGFSSDTDGTNIEYMRLQIINSPSDSYFTANTAKFKIEEIKLLNLELESGVVDFASLELGDSWNFDEDLDSFGLSGGVSQIFDGSGYLNYSRSADGEWGNVYNDLTSVTSVDLNKYTDFSFDYKVDNLISDEIAMIRLIFYDDKAANHYENIFIYDNIIFDGSWNTIKVSLNSLTITSCEFFRIYFSNQTGTPTLFAGDTILFDNVVFSYNERFDVEENAFYTTITSSDNLIYERFLGYNVDVKEFPFIEMKVRSNDLSICEEFNFGIHSLSYGNAYATISLSDRFEWYRLNLYQLVNSLNDNDISTLTDVFIDKIILSFNGVIDITSIKIYSIADWMYIPSDTDTIYTTAHLENSQESILRLDTDSMLAYTANVTDCDWGNEVYGYWEYNLEFMLTNTSEKTTLLSIFSENNQDYVLDVYIENNNIYFDDTIVTFDDTSFNLEIYRWFTLQCYSYYNYTGGNWDFTIHIEDTYSDVLHYTSNIGEINNVPNNITLAIETTDTPVYLRNINLSLNDSVTIGTHFSTADTFYYSTDNYSIDTWYVDTNGDCYLTKINQGLGGTIASSSMFLILDQGITFKRSTLGIEFMSPENFYIYLQSLCYGESFHIYVNDYDINANGLNDDTIYELNKLDVGTIVDTITLTTSNDYGYISKLHIWGNYSWGDFYTNFGDGDSSLNDWSHSSSHPMTISNTGDMVISDLTSFGDHRIAYYNAYFGDALISTSLNCSSASPYRDQNEYIIGYHVSVGIVFNSQSKSAYTLSSYSGYLLKYVSDIYYDGSANSSHIFLYRYDNGVPTQLFDYVSSSIQFPIGEEDDLPLQVSTKYYNSQLTIGVYFNNTYLGEWQYTSNIYESGYIGVYAEVLDDCDTAYDNVQSGAITEFSIMHKYYYPESDNVNYNTDSEENFFAGGRLYVVNNDVEIKDLGDFDEQKNIIINFEFPQLKPSCFIGFIYDKDGTPKYYGYLFKAVYGEVASEIWLLDGTTTLDSTGGTLINTNWLSENFGRTLYFVSTLYEPRSTEETYEYAIDIDIQLFSEKEFRPDTDHPLNNMVSIIYTNMGGSPPYDKEPIFSIKTVLDKNNLIIHNIEFGGVYPIDKEWLDESVSHGIRGAGEIADYYLQAKGQGSIKVDTSTSTVWMERPFYVPEQTDSTSISFTYLSSTPHSKDYVLLIYKDTTEFMKIEISSLDTNNTYEKITTSVKNGENYIVQTTHYVPYYQWITFSAEFSTTLELITNVAYNNKNLQEEGVIYAYLTVNTYYTFKLSKDIDSSGDTGNLYLASLALQNGAGFSSTFVNGDMYGWQLSDSSKFIYSTEVSLNPDSLTLYAEPFGGWCDITISVDDGEYIRTTRIEVEDEETFKPYLLRLPEEVDTTEIHKYTIIADGILTIYSIGFFKSVSINSWLITKPYVNDEIKEEVTSIGDTVVDFEDSNYSHEGTTSTNDDLLGSVGIMNNATEFDDDYLGITNPMTWDGNIGFWLKWDKGGTDVPLIRLGVIVINDYGDTPVNQLFDVYIHLRVSSDTLYNCLKYSHIIYHSYINQETGFTHAKEIHYNFYSDTNQWQYMNLDIGGLVAYYKTQDNFGKDRYNYIYGGFNFLEFDTDSSSSTIYLDDITLYDPSVKQPGIFARSYTYANGFNTQSVWVPQQVNSLGYIDFNSLDISGASLNEQSSFVIQCNLGADAQLHFSSSRPFLLYQGNTLIHTNYVLPNTIIDTYLDIHLYEGINRFTVRSISHTLLDAPWILKADILAPTNVEIVSEEYQSRKLSELNSNWFIDDWLVSDRPIYWESLDKYEIPQVGEDEYYEILYDKIDDFKMQELTVMLPYAGEQFNFTVPTEFDVDVTEWISFNYAYPNEDTGLVNYISGGMNNTNVDENDQIVYYTNLHFLDTYPNNQLLNLTYWGDIETIYYDSVYVYGKAGKTQHNDGTDVATESLGVNGTKTLSIDLWDWYKIQFYNETGHAQPHAPHFLSNVNPRNPGVHRITIIMNAPDTVEVNSMDLKASLSYLDDNVNCFTSITEYTSSKQSQQEKAAKVQLDQRSTPSDGSMSSHDKWTGKKVMESSITFDGIRYHSTRQVYVGIDNYETYEDIADPVGLGPEDAIGLLTTMIIYDAGTRHESSTIVQQAIGPNADAYENYQPTQLCIPYTMTSGIISDNSLLNTNNIRLSYSSQDTLYTSFKLQLYFNSNSLKSSQLSITNQSYYDEIISQFDSFLSSPDNEITITFSLTEPLTIQNSNETLIINTDCLYLTVDDLDIVFNKKLQILYVSYNDRHNIEEITVQLKSRMIMHLDPLGVHMSYKKAGSTNHGFIIYDIDKINSIGSGKISVPSHIRLGFFSSIKKFFKKVKDAFSTVVDAIRETMKTVNDRVKNFMETIGAQIKNAIHKLVDGVMVIVGFIVDGVTYLFEKIVTLVKGIVSVIKNIAVAIGQAIATFFERIFECFQAAWEWIKNAWNNVLEFCKAVIQKAKELLKKLFDILGKAFKWLIKKIGALFAKSRTKEDYSDMESDEQSKNSVNEMIRFESTTSNGPSNVGEWVMSSLEMDFMRLSLLSFFALIFGTNVGMYETDQVVTSVDGNRVFDDDIATDFSHVYQLDHVIDVCAGRQNLNGDSTFDPWDDSTWGDFNIKPGMGDNVDMESMNTDGLMQRIGAVFLDDEPFSRWNWVVCKQDDDINDFDWYFGLRTRLQFGYGKYAINVPFISEKTFITIYEVIVGILPLTGLIQDIKDAFLEPSPLFANLARFMIPFDILECFGDPTSIFLNKASDSTKTIKIIFARIFDAIRRIANGIKSSIKHFLGGKWAKILIGVAFVALIAITIIMGSLLPTAFWPVFGAAMALGALVGIILFFCHRGRKLADKNKVSGYVDRWQYEEASRMDKLISKTDDDFKAWKKEAKEIAKEEKKKLKKSWKERIKDFFKNKILRLDEINKALNDEVKFPHCALSCGIEHNPVTVKRFRQLFETVKNENWKQVKKIATGTDYTSLDDETKKIIDFICEDIYDTPSANFLATATQKDLDNLVYDSRYLSAFAAKQKNVNYENIIVGARLQREMEKQLTNQVTRLSDVLDATYVKDKNWRKVFLEDPDELNAIFNQLKNHDKVNYDILINGLKDSYKTKFNFIKNSLDDTNIKNLMGYIDEDLLYKYSESMITKASVLGKIRKTMTDEDYMLLVRKLDFDVTTDVRVELYNKIKLTGSDVKITTSEQSMTPFRFKKGTNGFDDACVIHWMQDGQPKHITLVDTLKYRHTNGRMALFMHTVNLNKRANVEDLLSKRNSMVAAFYDEEIAILKNRRPDVSMLDDELIRLRADNCLDSLSTDAILKMQKDGSNLLYGTQYKAISDNNYYKSSAININDPPIFTQKYDSWDLMMNDAVNFNENMLKWDNYVRERTDEIMLGYIRELQMQELASTGVATQVGKDFTINGQTVTKYFDEDGYLYISRAGSPPNKNMIVHTDEIPIKFVGPDGKPYTIIGIDGPYDVTFDVNQNVFQPKLQPNGKLAFEKLPAQFDDPDYDWIKKKIEDIQDRIISELELDEGYDFFLVRNYLDQKEKLQRDASTLMQRYLIQDGLIDGCASGQNGGYLTNAVFMGDNYSPTNINTQIKDDLWYHDSKTYDYYTYMEGRTNDNYRYNIDQKVAPSSRSGCRKCTYWNLYEIKTSTASKYATKGTDVVTGMKDNLRQSLSKLEILDVEYTKYIGKPTEFPEGILMYYEWVSVIEKNMKRLIDDIKLLEKELNLGTAIILDNFDDLSTEIAFLKDYLFDGTFNNPTQINYNTDIYIQDNSETKNHQYNALIVFKGEDGLNIKLDDERIGIVFSWDELLNKPDNPIRNCVGGNSIGDFLLMDPFTTKFSSSNPEVDWELLEGVSQYDPNPDIQNEFELASQWSLDNAKLSSTLSPRPEQQTAWEMLLSNKGYSEEIISFIKNQKQFDILHPEKNDDVAVLAYNAIGHEYNMLLFEFKEWIVDLLNNHDTVFKKWDKSNLDLSYIWENFKFKRYGKIKAWHDGCELTYDGLKKKQIVSLFFNGFVDFDYLDGTTGWSYISTPWTMNGYNSNIESKMGQITQEGLRYFATQEGKKANKFFTWIIGNVFSICGII